MTNPYNDPYDQPVQHGAHPQPALPGGPTRDQTGSESGFFSALADLRFTKFVTPVVVSVLYVLIGLALLVGLLIWTVMAFVTMSSDQDGSVLVGLLMLLAGPIVTLVYLVFARVSLEGMVALIRVADDVAAIRRGH